MTKYEVKTTNRFKKDYKRIRKQGLPKDELQKVVELLANGKNCLINTMIMNYQVIGLDTESATYILTGY